MAISPQRLTIYLYSAHRAVIFAIAELSCSFRFSICDVRLGFIKIVYWCSREGIDKIAVDVMHHLTCGISSFLHSVNLILFTLLLVYLILCISPHHSHNLRSHHLSLPQSFTPDLKLISFTNPFLHSLRIPPGRPSPILNLYLTNWALAFFLF